MNFKEQREVISTIQIQEGQSVRMDCPFCFNNHTFQLTKEHSKLKWYCFHASCDVKGMMDTEKTMDDVSYYLNKTNLDNDIEAHGWVIPDYFTSPRSDERCMKFLKYNHCMFAFDKGMAEIYFDPRVDRLVFIIKNVDDKVIGGVGRSLSYLNIPKWYVYGRRDCPFICSSALDSSRRTAVIVEDCASACSVSHNFTGLALMGTSLPYEFLSAIHNNFDRVIVALDRDATSKAFDIARAIAATQSILTRVVILEDDLKYYPPETIKEILCKNDN